MSADPNPHEKRLVLGIASLITGVGAWFLLAGSIGFKEAMRMSLPTVLIMLGITHLIEDLSPEENKK